MEFEVLIAGAGMAGVLAASQLASSFPKVRIGLIEKSLQLGGRLRSSLQVPGEWGYGLSLVSAALYQHIEQQLKKVGKASATLSSLISERQETFAFLSGGKLSYLRQEALFSQAAAKILGGMAAANAWQEVWDLIKDPKNSLSTLAKQGKQFGKNTAAVVLGQMGPLCGFASMWHAPMGAIAQRSESIAAGAYYGCWEKVVAKLLPVEAFPQLSVINDCEIAEARYSENCWQLHTSKGPLRGRWLLVAQSPWEAVEWLDKGASHPWLWGLASQYTPTSAVVLVEKLVTEDEAVDSTPIAATYVAAEETVVYRLGDGCLTCQAIVDFERSLHSPALVKTIKQLRRAIGKYRKALPHLKTEGEYLALKPVAWPLTGVGRQGQKRELVFDPLFHQSFCGDAYGSSFLPDENLIESLAQATSQIAAFLQGS